MEQLTGWLTAAEAAERLGVKPATLYAYVSRGVLARRRSPAGQSLFDPAPFLDGVIVAIHSEVVPGHGPTQQFDCGML